MSIEYDKEHDTLSINGFSIEEELTEYIYIPHNDDVWTDHKYDKKNNKIDLAIGINNISQYTQLPRDYAEYRLGKIYQEYITDNKFLFHGEFVIELLKDTNLGYARSWKIWIKPTDEESL